MTVKPDVVTFIGAEDAASRAVKEVFAVQVCKTLPNGVTNYMPIGSGIFTLGSHTIYGITCNHIIAGAEKLFGQGFDKTILIGIDTQDGYKRFPCSIPYRDPTNDIAILAPTHDARAQPAMKDVCLTADGFDDGTALVQGRGVLIVGYPLGLGVDVNSQHPVVRFGMIAQNAGGNSFLIDGMVNHGNSGSPVFALSTNGFPLVGIVSSFREEKIALFDENDELTAQLSYNSGLANVVKASIILNDVKEAIKRQ